MSRDITEAYFDKLLASITSSVKSMDITVFETLVDSVVAAEREGHKIIATGLGKNVAICEKFIGTMNSLGLNAHFMHSNSAIHGDLGLVAPRDLVIMLTKSGDTFESINLFEQLIKRDACLWLITFNTESVLAKRFPNVMPLSLDHEGDLWNIVPNNSTTVYLIILQAVAVCAAQRLDIPVSRFKANHPGGAIGAKLSNA